MGKESPKMYSTGKKNQTDKKMAECHFCGEQKNFCLSEKDKYICTTCGREEKHPPLAMTPEEQDSYWGQPNWGNPEE